MGPDRDRMGDSGLSIRNAEAQGTIHFLQPLPSCIAGLGDTLTSHCDVEAEGVDYLWTGTFVNVFEALVKGSVQMN